MTDELQLIAAAKAGSAEAFCSLARSYRERLLRFLLTRCASYADAEDVLQDTLIAAFRYLHSYDARWRFSTWLYRIAIRNVECEMWNVKKGRFALVEHSTFYAPRLISLALLRNVLRL